MKLLELKWDPHPLIGAHIKVFYFLKKGKKIIKETSLSTRDSSLYTVSRGATKTHINKISFSPSLYFSIIFFLPISRGFLHDPLRKGNALVINKLKEFKKKRFLYYL